MRAKYDRAEALSVVEQKMHAMLSGEVAPYSAGRSIWEVAFTHAKDYPEPMWPLWLIWGALMDWVEVKPQDKEQVEQEMLRASKEWLAIDRSDGDAREAYLRRWVHDELGIGTNDMLMKKVPSQAPDPTPPSGAGHL
jgi:hypothetical protein